MTRADLARAGDRASRETTDASHHPIFDRLKWDGAGRIWTRLTGSNDWVVTDPAGQRAKRVAVPRGLVVHQITGDRLAGVWRGGLSHFGERIRSFGSRPRPRRYSRFLNPSRRSSVRKHRSPVSVLALAAIMAAMVIGCGSHPIEPTVEPLVLQAIHAGEPDRGDESLGALWLEVGGAFVVTAFVEEPEAVAAQTSLEALVTTDSGDEETVILQRALCEAAQVIHVCRRVGVTMNPSLHVRSLASALGSENLGWLSHSLSEGRHGVIELPAGTEDISAAMAAVANLEGVEATWLDQVAGPDVIGWEPTQHLRGMLPMTFADAAPHDGVLQVHPGDEVTITYVQPDGTSLSTTIGVPQPDA